ncbi:hypothetical protein BAT02nite_28930 [Bacillus atrophaeus]|nr:hypothetical protein BAT02nite_28930 [Bacillus atrophaeus]
MSWLKLGQKNFVTNMSQELLMSSGQKWESSNETYKQRRERDKRDWHRMIVRHVAKTVHKSIDHSWHML